MDAPAAGALFRYVGLLRRGQMSGTSGAAGRAAVGLSKNRSGHEHDLGRVCPGIGQWQPGGQGRRLRHGAKQAHADDTAGQSGAQLEQQALRYETRTDKK